MIDDEELALLYDLNSSKNPDFQYLEYPKFDLDKMNDDECKAEFRFLKNDIYELREVLGIPDEHRCYNRVVISGIEATCILLKRFAYPCRFGDMVPRFGRPKAQLSMIAGEITSLVYNLHHHRLETFNQPWLSRIELERYAQCIHDAGAPLQNCWGFVDGTVRPICRPGTLQRTVYNGHKRVHALKFQSVVAPNGLVANMYGPVEGKRHDSGMLRDSDLYTQLQQFSYTPNGQALCIYGDLAYPLRRHLLCPFIRGAITPQQQAFNTAMSKVRAEVEWVFNDICNFFAFLSYKKNLKIGLSPIGKMYLVCTLLTNARTCLYGSMSSSYFGIDPPQLRDYFV